jgi:class 3 adenylate cyclase
MALSLVMLIVPVRPGAGVAPVTWWQTVAIGSFLLVTPIVGGLIASRKPRNPIGWLVIILPLGFALNFATDGLVRHVRPTGAVLDLAWAMQQLSGASIVALLFLLVYFPDGHLPSTRWRIVPALVGIGTLLYTIVGAFSVTPVFAQDVPNPFAAPSLAHLFDAINVVAGVCLLAALLGTLGLIIVRFRRSQGEVRQQMKWFSYGAAIVIAPMLLGTATAPLNLPFDFWTLTLTLLAILPITIGIAILRYRLYDIDVLINRTVVYGTVTVLLAAAFGLANVGLQRIFESLTGQHSDLIAGGVGAVAALAVGPVRRRVRPVVDRFLPSRALLTLLFTDIVGSTKAIVELGDEHWRGLLGRYLATVRQELAHFGGREVNTAGDAFFATFSRPVAGVQCAWAIRSAVKKLGLETRTGVHIGECEMRGEQVSGLAVHTAARVMAEAGDGEIFVSDALRDAMSDANVELLDRGRHQLKGVPGEWQLYALEAAQGLA